MCTNFALRHWELKLGVQEKIDKKSDLLLFKVSFFSQSLYDFLQSSVGNNSVIGLLSFVQFCLGLHDLQNKVTAYSMLYIEFEILVCCL